MLYIKCSWGGHIKTRMKLVKSSWPCFQERWLSCIHKNLHHSPSLLEAVYMPRCTSFSHSDNPKLTNVEIWGTKFRNGDKAWESGLNCIVISIPLCVVGWDGGGNGEEGEGASASHWAKVVLLCVVVFFFLPWTESIIELKGGSIRERASP